MKLKELKKHLKNNNFLQVSNNRYELAISEGSRASVTITRSMSIIFELSVGYVAYVDRRCVYGLSELNNYMIDSILKSYKKCVDYSNKKNANKITSEYALKISDDLINPPLSIDPAALHMFKVKNNDKVEEAKEKTDYLSGIAKIVKLFSIVVLLMNLWVDNYDVVMALGIIFIYIELALIDSKKG